jgi:lincosamide nucleotidyltransferase A/C/D/E
MTGPSVLKVIGLLESQDIDVWIDGGWGVDALLGHETREHDDLDLVAEIRHSERIIELLHRLGYELVEGTPPRSFVLVDEVGQQVDVHPVTFDAEGGGVYQMEGDRVWVYPAEGFSGRGSVEGRRVRCLSPKVQVIVHAGYELTEKEYRELYLLRERFGVEPPDELLEHVLAAGGRARTLARRRPSASVSGAALTQMGEVVEVPDHEQ